MNFAKSILNVSNVVVRSINSQVKLVRFMSVSTVKLSNSCSYNLSRKNPLSVSSQQSQRFAHSAPEYQSDYRSNTSLVVKKRPLRKKRLVDQAPDGRFTVYAYATAHEYDLEALHTALTKQDLYETKKFYIEDGEDVLHVRSKYNVEPEPRDIFFFREGSVVLWNCGEPETNTVLRNLKQFEIGSYTETIIKAEKEFMSYRYVEDQTGNLKNDTFLIQENGESDLERYTFSNAMTSSVKLGIWEAMLENYIDGLANVTSDLKNGRKIRMSRGSILQRTGELFALKHSINLDSDLLETPDFYWDRDKLEQLFNKTTSYFSIAKRKRVSSLTLIHLIFIFTINNNVIFFVGHK